LKDRTVEREKSTSILDVLPRGLVKRGHPGSVDFYALAVMVGIFVATTVCGTQFLKDRTRLYDRFFANLWPPVRLLIIVLLAAAFWVVVLWSSWSCSSCSSWSSSDTRSAMRRPSRRGSH